MSTSARCATHGVCHSVSNMTTNTAVTTTATRQSRAARIARFPFTWLILGIIAVGAVSIFVGAGPFPAVLAAAGAVAAYWAVMRFIARRRTPELTTRSLITELSLGAGIAVGLLGVSLGIITLTGSYHFTFDGAAGLSALPALVAIAIGASVTEEIIFRGLALQAIERLTGSWIALIITAGAFGLIHALNPAASVWTTIAISVEAGLLMGAVFLWRRNLWAAIALHATWNGLVQVVGIPVSGHTDTGLLVATVDGPTWLTGGDFGIEGSVLPVILSLTITTAILLRARRAGTLVAAPWRKAVNG